MTIEIKCTINAVCLITPKPHHLTHPHPHTLRCPAKFMEKLSCMKLVPGAKKTRELLL